MIRADAPKRARALVDDDADEDDVPGGLVGSKQRKRGGETEGESPTMKSLPPTQRRRLATGKPQPRPPLAAAEDGALRRLIKDPLAALLAQGKKEKKKKKKKKKSAAAERGSTGGVSKAKAAAKAPTATARQQQRRRGALVLSRCLRLAGGRTVSAASAAMSVGGGGNVAAPPSVYDGADEVEDGDGTGTPPLLFPPRSRHWRRERERRCPSSCSS